MEDVVDRLVELDVLHEVVVDERERAIANVLDVLERSRVQVVDADHAVAALEQVVAEVRAEEAGSAGHDSSGHGRMIVALLPK